MNKIKGYNIVKEKTNELLVSIEIENDEVIEKDGYKVIPFYEEGNPTIEQNVGENKPCSKISLGEESREKHHRPFKDCSELIEVYQKKYKSAVGCDIYFPSLYKPVIWVKHKEFGTESLITAFDNNNESIGANVIINDMGVTMKMLFYNYTFCDGSVCGVEN